MNESRAITGLDRLPWLEDEREVPRRRASSGQPIALALLILGIAALSYWLGTKSWSLFPDPQSETTSADRAIPLPQPVPVEPEPDILNEPPAVAEPLPSVPAPATSSPRPAKRPAAKARTTAAAPKSTEDKKSETSPRQPWPVREVEGSAGRLVQVGTFSTRRQAKRGWNALMRVNPSLQRLPAMVVPIQSKRDSRVYYRLQMGTTSQAHSVVLCQKLRMIGQSCIVTAEPVKKEAE